MDKMKQIVITEAENGFIVNQEGQLYVGVNTPAVLELVRDIMPKQKMTLEQIKKFRTRQGGAEAELIALQESE